jgi:hypothetical protein
MVHLAATACVVLLVLACSLPESTARRKSSCEAIPAAPAAGFVTFSANVEADWQSRKYRGHREFYVQVVSEHGYRLCEGVFNRRDLAYFSCPYDHDALADGNNVFFITVLTKDKSDVVMETRANLW